jgi:hypothetical protein
MNEERWFTAAEATAAGLADVIEPPASVENRQTFDLSGYANTPAAMQLTEHGGGSVDAASRERVAVMRKRLALVERGERS